MSKKITLYYALPVILLSTLLVAAVIWAWTEPGAVPPSGNVPAPINVGGNPQSRGGSLMIGTTGGLFETYHQTMLATVDGNVGIGTTTPATKLDVVGTVRMAGFQLGTSATAGHVLTTNISGVGTWQAPTEGYWALNGTSIYNTNTGNVGIGVTNPDPLYKLVVAGDVRIGGDNVLIGQGEYLRISAPSLNASFFAANGNVTFGDFSGNTRMQINQSGAVGIGTGTPDSKLHVVGGVCVESTDTGGCVVSAGDVRGTRLCIGGDCRTFWPSGGGGIGGSGATNYLAKFTASTTIGNSQIFDNGTNVGIGTTAPSAKLHVVGGARITGLTSCNTIDTDASGNLFCGADTGGGTPTNCSWTSTISGNNSASLSCPAGRVAQGMQIGGWTSAGGCFSASPNSSAYWCLRILCCQIQ